MMSQLRFTDQHEWVRIENGIGTVGITKYAAEQLGDVVYVDLPKIASQFVRMDVFGTIEAVKAVSELFAPLTGSVVEVNRALADDPALINKDPYGNGWMIKLRLKHPAELDQLLGSEEYAQHIGE